MSMTTNDNPYPDFEGAWVLEEISTELEEDEQEKDRAEASRASEGHGPARNAVRRNERKQSSLVGPEPHGTK
jgi:hypothetical protein